MYFREFLHRHFNSENLSFWLEVEDYRARTPDNDLKMRANEIYNIYLRNGAELEVNVPAKIKKAAAEQLSNPTR